ncbi:hypothetical protein LXA43DRAFT_895347 [Ganoderma leucocontextum]|nr:hypothetical protein LXA43DRAFT_895347 [Ganoderma leucocontextum]
MTASPCLDDFRSQRITGDDASGTVWSDGIASHCVEQPSYLSVNAGRHVPASTVFADHNLGFGESACFTTPSYDDNCPATSYCPSPPSTPQSLPRDHDRQHIFLPKHGSPATPATPATNRWKCPYCNYVQGRRRMVDLKRHIATHNKPSDVALWTCCGFPREVARSKGVPDNVVRETSVIYGRVGGCWETFSRRDALQRHLRKQKGRCFGDAYADWHPGNSTKRDRRTNTRAPVESTWTCSRLGLRYSSSSIVFSADTCQWD